ncbi:MAG TPA: hypothetical protein VE974_10720 [Thermoanaerobaculia bacterium]|nr:hypothetical protein [Thermoanaerobaculia bacterium]
MHYKSLSRIVRTTIESLAATHLLLIALAMTALLATTSASAQTVNQVRPYSGTTTNPCNGELVDFNGSIHFNEKTQIGLDGRIHFIANNNFNASGVGRTTRITYNIGGTMKTNSKFPSYPISYRQKSKFISTGSAPNFHTTFAFHVNGAGVQTNVTTESTCN